MKFEFVNELNYLLEAAYYLEKRLSKKHDHTQVIKSLIEYGVPREKITKAFNNYQKLVDALEKEELVVDPVLRPFVQVGSFGHSLTTNLIFHVLCHHDDNLDQTINFFLSSYLSSFVQEAKDDDLVINNLADLIRVLNLTDFDNETKMIFISFYYDYQNLYHKLEDLLQMTSRIIFKYNYLIKNEVMQNYEEAKERIRQYPLFIKTVNDEKLVKVHPSIFAFNEMSIMGETLNQLCYGYLFFKLSDLKSESTTEETLMVNCLKALSDKTRFRIVSMLQNKKLYLQELSRMVGLTPATVSYHLDYLKRFNLIEIDEVSLEQKKIFYRLNTSVLNKLIHHLNKLMEGN